MEELTMTKCISVVDKELLELNPGVPLEYWELIEFEELKIADLEISMNRIEEEGDEALDTSKPKVDANGKPISLRFVYNAIQILKMLFQDSLIDEKNDILKDIYEGGFKVWECTLDLLKHLNETMLPVELKGKNVIDVGCGHGLLGLQALIYGAENVYFQDFNIEVLKYAVIPNLYANGLIKLFPRTSYISGDWSKTFEKIKNGVDDVAKEGKISTTKATKFDLVLMSEVLYCKDNYEKLVRLITELLSDKGICVISTKLYYFGCSGSLPEFRDYVKDNWPKLSYKSVKQIHDKKSNKREIICLSFQD